MNHLYHHLFMEALLSFRMFRICPLKLSTCQLIHVDSFMSLCVCTCVCVCVHMCMCAHDRYMCTYLYVESRKQLWCYSYRAVHSIFLRQGFIGLEFAGRIGWPASLRDSLDSASIAMGYTPPYPSFYCGI